MKLVFRSITALLLSSSPIVLFPHSALARSFYSYNNKKMRIETDSEDTITIHPEDGSHSASVVLMHGLGDSSAGWQDVAQQWAGQFPHVKFILPTAATIPVTLNGGMSMPAWYDIVGLSGRANEQCDGIEASVSRITNIIDSEAAAGIPYHRIALAGFSQGGAMSLFTGLQLPAEKKPAGLLVLSGYLPGISKFRLTPGFEDVKVLHCHGSADQVVRFAWAEQTKQHLVGLGLSHYELKSYSGMPHSATMEEITYAGAFLSSILPYDPALAIPRKAPESMTIKELKAAIRHAGLGSRAQGLSEKHELVALLTDHYTSTTAAARK